MTRRWDLDYFLHENPELKRAPFAWLTDFVGWLPMPDGGAHEAALTSDYNAEMVEHIARYPRLRDRALFVGDPDDVVPDSLGPGLPGIREWTEEHFDFTGYVTGFDPADVADRAGCGERLGYATTSRSCVVAVGGSGVGEHLLRRVVEAYREAPTQVPGLRMVLVAGPRIDPGVVAAPAGDRRARLRARPATTTSRPATSPSCRAGSPPPWSWWPTGRPFLYVPLRNHFEQNFHVAHRLDRHHAGRRLDWSQTRPENIAAALAEEIARTPDYRPVGTDGAARAAERLDALI